MPRGISSCLVTLVYAKRHKFMLKNKKYLIRIEVSKKTEKKEVSIKIRSI